MGSSMTISDVIVIAIIYATCLLFLSMTLDLVPAAQIYPLCLIAGLAILNTCYLIRCIVRLYREKAAGTGLVNNLPEIFKGFQSRQFLFIVAACIAYMGMLYYLGFYLAGAIYLIGVLIYLGVKPIPITVTTAFLGALVYGVFDLFLKVPLPKGVLFS